MVFRDSLQFCSASIVQLVVSLYKTGRENFITLHIVVAIMFPIRDVSLLDRKEVIFYDHVDCLERLKEQALHHQEALFYKLSGGVLKCGLRLCP